MIVSEEILKEYTDAIKELKNANKQIQIAIQGLEAIMLSGQINIADKTLEAIKEVKNYDEKSM
tara:strand:+ start:3868 stop:4056 length:189 start_codon:yes stop_codon:yes gene_type:complete